MAVAEGDQASEGPISFSQSHRDALPSIERYNGIAEVWEDEPSIENITDEDAQSLISVSISRAASHMASPKTPAVEKAAIMERLEGELSETDEETTPTAESPASMEHTEIPQKPQLHELSRAQMTRDPETVAKKEDITLPSPWQAVPKRMVVQRPESSRSALRDAFSPSRPRSFSGSETIRKFFPSLPSMPKASSLMPGIPSPTFFSFSNSPSSKARTSPNGKNIPRDVPPEPASPIVLPPPISENKSILPTSNRVFQSNVDNSTVRKASDSQSISSSQKALRRSNSDDTLLYHSLSRASSLGDDTRFENQHEMINSRLKALKDSYKDMSSFRLPNFPSIQGVPRPNLDFNSFSFNIGGSSASVKGRSHDEGIRDSPVDIVRSLNSVPKPGVRPEVTSANIAQPAVVSEPEKSLPPRSHASALESVLGDLKGDIVIMGGYRGSMLRSAKTHKQLWIPIKVGLNLRKVNMEVGLEPEDEIEMEKHIYSSGMIQHIGPVDVSRRLFKNLRDSENVKNGSLRVWDYGFDWRLSPKFLSMKLVEFLDQLPSNKTKCKGETHGALVIAHSLGGLITRHAVNQRPELFSGVVYAGVPQSCVNILGPLRNGDEVLFSSRVLTAQVNFTHRASFALLPLDGFCFIDKTTKESYMVDFFSVDDWIKYRWSPCIGPPLPPKTHPTGTFANLLKNVDLPNFQLARKNNTSAPKKSLHQSSSSLFTELHDEEQSSPSLPTQVSSAINFAEGNDRTLAPQMNSQHNPVSHGERINNSISTAVTIPRDKAIEYLRRTLAEIKQFKLELAHDPDLTATNLYPPFAIIYGKSVPTVYGARVDGRDAIACADAYDDLAFASGDGVALAKEAMLPEGYHVVKGGRISTDRGHITLLGDLNAVGKVIQAVLRGREKGIGLGVERREGM